VLFDDSAELDYQSIKYLTCRFIKLRNFIRVRNL